MKVIAKYCLFIFLLVVTSCQKREWNNPFDPECPKEIFTPDNFIAKQEGNVVKLTWSQTNTQISGFAIERSVDNGSWTSAATPAKAESTWSDANITGGKVHAYRIVAKAGNNASNTVSVSITPVLTANVTTTEVSVYSFNGAILGGSATSDGGSSITERGVCYGLTKNSTLSNSYISMGSGIGNFSFTVTGLRPNSVYYARSYATNSSGTAYGNEVSFKTSNAPSLSGIVTDIDGNVYNTISIGNQVWIAENLKTTKYNDGTVIPNVTDNAAWISLTSAAYCWYGNNASSYKNTYGALYNWYAVNSGKLAPIGWHVPTVTEWEAFVNFIGSSVVSAQIKMQFGWDLNVANNETGFSLLPAGFRAWDNGSFQHKGYAYNYWLFSEDPAKTGVSTGYVLTDWVGGILIQTGLLNEGSRTGKSVRCLKNAIPVISTTVISFTTQTTANSGGVISSDGGAPITARGVCWSTSPNPTTANSKTTDGTGTGSFTSSITGLTANTTYYVRAYATNSQGTAYGAQESFTTSQTVSMATVTSTAVTTFTTTTAVLGGNVTSDGNATVTERGVVYATTLNPTTANTKVAIGTGTGTFSTTVSGLTANTTYYVRAYAINSQGTAYGNQVSFTTNQTVSIATVTTSSASNITTSGASLGGNVTSDGNATVTERGVVYATTQNPTTANMKVAIGTGTGTFSTTVSGLTANTTYYVRAYAINSQGTAYGSEVSFKTESVSGNTVTDIDGNVYQTVTIGTQVWIAENLKTTKYNDGTSIPNITDNTEWIKLTTGAYCWYNNEVENKAIYGALYNWYAVNTEKLCPIGWHVPTDEEWTTLVNYLGGTEVAGGEMKSITGWRSPNTGATNSSGFSGLPSGSRISNGIFGNIGNGFNCWSSTVSSSRTAWSIYLLYSMTRSYEYNGYYKEFGFSVRCLKD
jgi:uncharacterized protein (TIGR02145 family)